MMIQIHVDGFWVGKGHTAGDLNKISASVPKKTPTRLPPLDLVNTHSYDWPLFRLEAPFDVGHSPPY